MFHLLMVKQMSRKTPSVRVRCRHLFSWPFALNPQIAKLHIFAFHGLTIPKYPRHTSGTWQNVDNIYLTILVAYFDNACSLPELRGYHPQPLDLTSIRTKAERDV